MSSNTEGFATLTSSPLFVNIPTLGATPTKVEFPLRSGITNVTAPSQTVVRARITNLHDTNHVSFTVEGQDATVGQVWNSATGASPAGSYGALTCGAAGALNAHDGIRVSPGSSIEVNLSPRGALWVVASAANTPVQVVYFLQNG